MTKWTNWSGRVTGNPESLRFSRSESDLQAVVAQANHDGRQIRVVGSGHSHYPLVPTSGTIVDLSGLSGVISTDNELHQAQVWAGTKIYALGRPLHEVGLGLANQGDIDRQAIGGAVATGTHGTGLHLTSLSAAVVGLTLITAQGDRVELDADSPTDQRLWSACRLNLGALGVVTRLNLAVRPAYRLAENGWICSYDEIHPRIAALASQYRHFEFFWYPGSDQVVAKTIDETQQDVQYPLGKEGARVGWSYEVLPNDRPHRHTEMEYSVPLQRGPACLAAIRQLITTRFADLKWPVEYRTVAADDVWLSTAFGQPVATISVHQGIDLDDEPLFRACEEVFVGHEGRPHWGKVHYLDGEQLGQCHPHWERWWDVRNEADPKGVFLNDRLRALAP